MRPNNWRLFSGNINGDSSLISRALILIFFIVLKHILKNVFVINNNNLGFYVLKMPDFLPESLLLTGDTGRKQSFFAFKTR